MQATASAAAGVGPVPLCCTGLVAGLRTVAMPLHKPNLPPCCVAVGVLTRPKSRQYHSSSRSWTGATAAMPRREADEIATLLFDQPPSSFDTDTTSTKARREPQSRQVFRRPHHRRSRPLYRQRQPDVDLGHDDARRLVSHVVCRCGSPRAAARLWDRR